MVNMSLYTNFHFIFRNRSCLTFKDRFLHSATQGKPEKACLKELIAAIQKQKDTPLYTV